MVMFCFNLCPLIHNSTHRDCSYRMSARGFDWRLSVWFSTRSRATLQRMISSLFPLMGWLNSHNFGWGINACVNEAIHWRDLGFLLFSFVHKTPCEINARQSNIWRRCTDSLARWIMARHEGDGNFCFIVFTVFPALVGDGTSKASAY